MTHCSNRHQFLLIAPLDFSGPLFGRGSEAKVKSIIRELHADLALVGLANETQILGEWTHVSINGNHLSLLPVIRESTVHTFHWIPTSILFALSLIYHRRSLSSCQTKSALTATYSVLWLLALFGGWDVCYVFPGLGNPFSIGRFQFVGKLLAPLYEIIQAWALRHANAVYAAASLDALECYNRRFLIRGMERPVRQCRNGVDLSVFKPSDKLKSRDELGVSPLSPVFAFVGRLAAIKGIPLLFESLRIVQKDYPDAIILIAGDGEERNRLSMLARKMGILRSVRILGSLSPSQVSSVISASDVCVVSSFTEGMSHSMLEELACGRPIVTTAVSGATDIIINGVNGYIVDTRDPVNFASRMIDSLSLTGVEEVSRGLAEAKFSDIGIWNVLLEEWMLERAS